jgi:hypothetical protein
MAQLTEPRVRSAKPRERAYKLFDERGLFLFVTPAGGRLWRFRYRIGALEKLISLGAYPDVTLKRAREKRDEARTRPASCGADRRGGVSPCAWRRRGGLAVAIQAWRARYGGVELTDAEVDGWRERGISRIPASPRRCGNVL